MAENVNPNQIIVELSVFHCDVVDLKPGLHPSNENDVDTSEGLTIENIVNGLHSSDLKLQYMATQAARKILCPEFDPPIDLIINHGIVPVMIKFLDCHEYPELQFEAAWTLTNVASGTTDQTKCIVDGGGLPKLISLLDSPVSNVVNQAIWALGNIALDGATMRDLVLNHNVTDRLLPILSKDIPLNEEQNIMWLISNLCRIKNPPPPFEKIKPLLPILSRYLLHSDTKLVSDVCKIFAFISDVDTDKIHVIIQAGVLPQLVELLGSPETKIVGPALRTLGNIVNGTDIQTDAVIEAGALPYFRQLLKSSKQEIVYWTAWTVSNIAAGNRNQIQALFTAEIFHEIGSILVNGDFQSKKEAAWIITNTTAGGSFKQVVDLINLQVLEPFCKLLDLNDPWCFPSTIKVVLNGLQNMLTLTDQYGGLNDLCFLIEDANGLVKLESLQNYENVEICQQAYEIVGKYFRKSR